MQAFLDVAEAGDRWVMCVGPWTLERALGRLAAMGAGEAAAAARLGELLRGSDCALTALAWFAETTALCLPVFFTVPLFVPTCCPRILTDNTSCIYCCLVFVYD